MRRWFNILIYIFAGVGLFLVLGYLAVYLGLTNTPGGVDLGRHFRSEADFVSGGLAKNYVWNQGTEWVTLKGAIEKDAKVINQAAQAANIDPRLLAACLVVEQLRLFHSEREVFKQVFAPLIILGTQSQFSWGVMGMKPETAKLVEQYLKDANSPYYLGARYEHLLDFTTTNHDEERFERLVDEHDHYWSYLYSALYLKQLQTAWAKTGYPIENKVGVLATLFNIGFDNSQPKSAPQVGGALISINGTDYTFGGLAAEFYYANELTTDLPLLSPIN
ncbi:MAG: hypothetical protein Q7T49_00765 [bacterium]|nr:hypothetical protein [bacterium]